MKTIRNVALAILGFLPLISPGTGLDPEAVYAKFHQAALESNFDMMKKYGSSKGAEELAAMPALVRKGALAMMAMALPNTYRVIDKTIAGDSAKLQLIADKDGKAIKGDITWVLEAGVWKVEETAWSGAVGDKAEAKPERKEEAPAPLRAESAKGTINGLEFLVEKATLRGSTLTLRQGQDFFADRQLTIFLASSRTKLEQEGRIVITPTDFMAPHIHMSYRTDGKKVPTTKIFMNRNSMTLELRDNEVWIDLRLPDATGSFLSGRFELQ